eukprot:scaffold2169_cov72-Phaeocystis_antarctica.AAC.5
MTLTLTLALPSPDPNLGAGGPGDAQSAALLFHLHGRLHHPQALHPTYHGGLRRIDARQALP